MRPRIPRQAGQWSQLGPDSPVIRINWPRVAFAGLLALTITTLLTVAFRPTNEHNTHAVSGGPSAAKQASPAPQVEPATNLQLIAEAAVQGTDDRLPLGIFVSGPIEIASTAAIEIIGLPGGWAVSAGRPFGESGWRILAAKLSGTVLLPPRGFSGAIEVTAELRLADDTLVERRSVRRARIDPALATMPPQPIESERSTAITSPSPSAPLGENVASQPLTWNTPEPDSEQITLLLRVAEGLLAAGDLSAARTVLRRAAKAGNARAALLLGETYDGGLLRRFVCSPDADRSAARTWYEVAREFGSVDARRRLDRLAPDEAEGDP